MNLDATSVPMGIGARQRLLDAALATIRMKGYSATSVDELCAQAGVSKGAFFHHFKSKDTLAVAAARHWSDVTGALFETASYHRPTDPLERFLGYIDFRKTLIQGEIADFSCLVGTMIQETYATHPAIREACEASITEHTSKLEADIALAMQRYRIRGAWTAESLALHTQVVLQGAFILAKAKSASAALASIDHLRRYIEFLFPSPTRTSKDTV